MKRLLIILALFPIFAFAQTRADVLRELHRQQVQHPQIVLAQARLESGNFKAKTYLDTGNLLGIKKNGKYVVYPRRNWRECISDYKKIISSRYLREGGGNYYVFLKRMGYAKDKNYIQKVKSCVKSERTKYKGL